MTEDQLQNRVIHLARLGRWMVAHFRPALSRSGRWSTPMQGDKGFPDLVLVRRGQLIVAELKRQDGRIRDDQREWLAALGEYGRLWRPSDLPAIEAELLEGRNDR